MEQDENDQFVSAGELEPAAVCAVTNALDASFLPRHICLGHLIVLLLHADVFLRQLSGQQPPAPAGQRSNAAQKRASLAQLAGIRNKISLWEKTVPGQPQPAAQQQATTAQLQRKPAGSKAIAPAPKLAPVSEEEAPEPRRRSNGSTGSAGSLYSRAAAIEEQEERRASGGAAGGGGLLSRAAAAVHAVLPSPGTKQAMAARQEAVRFPSIMFGAKPPPRQPARGALPKPREAASSGGNSQGSQWRLAAGTQQAGSVGSVPAAAEDHPDDASDSSSGAHGGGVMLPACNCGCSVLGSIFRSLHPGGAVAYK
jgi:hypothetical protein